MKHIFELRMKDQIEERSSQLLRNLSSCEKKAIYSSFFVFYKTKAEIISFEPPKGEIKRLTQNS